MKATHTDYCHPKHLRVEVGGDVLCIAPSCSYYSKLNKGLPSYSWKLGLPMHSSHWSVLDG